MCDRFQIRVSSAGLETPTIRLFDDTVYAGPETSSIDPPVFAFLLSGEMVIRLIHELTSK